MRKTSSYICALLLSVLLAGCATGVVHNTPSGRPEITITGKVGKVAAGEITNMMVDRGYNVKSSTDNLMVFEKPLQGAASILLASNYDVTPVGRVTFNIIENPTATRVVASLAAITNAGSAFEKSTNWNDSKDAVQYQSLLNDIKLRIERGG
jgi:hypothetical protein